MFVCHCIGVREGEIRRAVRAGASTLRQVARACGAGTGCGGCSPLVAEIVASERDASSPLRVAVVPETAAAS